MSLRVVSVLLASALASWSPSAIAAVKAIYVNGVYMGCSFEDGSHLRNSTETNITYSPARVNSYLCITFYGGQPVNRSIARQWGLGFSVGPFADGLRNPRYALEPIHSPGELEYRVVDNRQARDAYTPGFAFMTHVLRTGPSARLFEWSPLTAGFGVANGAEPRFLLGTSLQTANRLVATAGVSFGKVDRLPDALTVGRTTFDSNALDDLPRRYKASWVAGLSYRFGGDAMAAARPNAGPGECAATAATEVAQIANRVAALRTLREFRRSVLSTTAEGRTIAALYSRHTGRVAYLFMRDGDLLQKGAAFVAAALPVARSMVDGAGEATALTEQTLTPSIEFANALIAADDRHAGGPLSADVRQVLRLLSPETLEGVSAAQALRRMAPATEVARNGP